jgi:hypothetical protein
MIVLVIAENVPYRSTTFALARHDSDRITPSQFCGS